MDDIRIEGAKIRIPIDDSSTDDEASVIESPQSAHTRDDDAFEISNIYGHIPSHISNNSDDDIVNRIFSSEKKKRKEVNYLWPATSRYQSAFLVVSIFAAAVVLGLQIYIFYVFSQNLPVDRTETKIRSIQTYLGLFTFATVYQLCITYLAILKRNVLQLSILLLFLVAMIVYSGVQFYELKLFLIDELFGDWKRATTAAIIIIIAVLCVALVIESLLVSLKLKREFDWDIYRTLGSSVQVKRKFSVLQFYKALLTFDAFFLPAFTIQFIIINLERSDPEFYITIVVLPMTLVILHLAVYAANKQSKKLLSLTMLAYLCGLAYVFFKVIRLYTYSKYDPQGYLPGRRSLTTFGVITIFLLLATIAITTKVWLNFGKRERVSEIYLEDGLSDAVSNAQHPTAYHGENKPILIID